MRIMAKTQVKKSKWKSRVAKVFIGFLIFCVVLIVSGFAYEFIASQRGLKQYPPPGKMVDVGEHSLHLQKYENDGPTIVLETGNGASSLFWEDLPTTLSAYGTVVAYDRGGYAWSEEPKTERSGENIVRELHTALKKSELEGPYILVGHSLGGMYVRLFAELFPEDVAGLVLLDARPENYSKKTNPILEEAGLDPLLLNSPPKEMMVFMEQTGVLRLMGDELFQDTPEERRHQVINVDSQSKYYVAKQEELEHLSDLEGKLQNQSLGSLPITIVTRGIPTDATAFGVPAEHNDFMEDEWQEQQLELKELSSNVNFVIAEQSGHNISKDQPDIVEEAVAELLERIEKETSE